MKLSTRSRYASRAMLDLALHDGQRPQVLRDVARRQDVSLRYLENIMTRLVARGLVRSLRGKGGGFLLAREPSEIRLDQILQAVEGDLSPVSCGEDPQSCHRSSSCVMRDVWKGLRECMREYLSALTLNDLAERHREEVEGAGQPMYHI